MKIAIIGTVNLVKSISKGLITNNAITSLYLPQRNPETIQKFEGYQNVTITSDNVLAVQKSDILICAVQPAHFESILKEIQPFLTDNHIIISAVTVFIIPKI